MDMSRMLTKMVKEHNAEHDYLEKFNKGIKFLSMGLYNHDGYENFSECHGFDREIWLTRYEVKFTFKANDPWDDNIVKYMVNMYSDGSIGFYFDGTEWVSNK